MKQTIFGLILDTADDVGYKAELNTPDIRLCVEHIQKEHENLTYIIYNKLYCHQVNTQQYRLLLNRFRCLYRIKQFSSGL